MMSRRYPFRASPLGVIALFVGTSCTTGVLDLLEPQGNAGAAAASAVAGSAGSAPRGGTGAIEPGTSGAGGAAGAPGAAAAGVAGSAGHAGAAGGTPSCGEMPAGGEVVIASYQRDYRTDPPLAAGWAYLWNAPCGWTPGSEGDLSSGAIDAPTCYQPLVDAGDSWTVDGDQDGQTGCPGGRGLVRGTHAHPAWAVGMTCPGGPDQHDRFAIAAFTIPEPGCHRLQGRFSRASAEGDGDEVRVYLDVGTSSFALVHQEFVAPGAAVAPALVLGWLPAGGTIYVAVGPSGDTNYDALGFDFDVVRDAMP